jgi:hypothetical protein
MNIEVSGVIHRDGASPAHEPSSKPGCVYSRGTAA